MEAADAAVGVAGSCVRGLASEELMVPACGVTVMFVKVDETCGEAVSLIICPIGNVRTADQNIP